MEIYKPTNEELDNRVKSHARGVAASLANIVPIVDIQTLIPKHPKKDTNPPENP